MEIKQVVRTKPKQKKESLIEEEILYFLNSIRDSFFWKNPSSGYYDGKTMRKHASKFCMNGASDILGLYKGTFYALEVKTPTTIKFYETNKERLEKTPSWFLKTKKEQHFRRQIEFQKKIKVLGGKSFFVSSLKDVKKYLEINV
jgi:hypothetical protein